MTDPDDLPAAAVEAAERLTRLARDAEGEERAAYERERDALLADHGFAARLRGDDVLVVHPAEWVEGGDVRVERVDELGRATEIPLDGGGGPDDWAAVEEHNAELVGRVAEVGGAVHAANARAFADFMGNHHARRVETASEAEVRRFLESYYRRNVWPENDQRAVVETSLALLFDVADETVPGASAVHT